MTQTRPCRLMMRHFSHIFLALGRTFILGLHACLRFGANGRAQPTPGGRRLRPDDGSQLVVSGVVSTLCCAETDSPTVLPGWYRRAHQTGPEGPERKSNATLEGPQVRKRGSAARSGGTTTRRWLGAA